MCADDLKKQIETSSSLVIREVKDINRVQHGSHTTTQDMISSQNQSIERTHQVVQSGAVILNEQKNILANMESKLDR